MGNGANEVITFVIKAFCQEGDNIITADKTFAVYEWVAEFSGFEARLVPLKDFGFDAEGMLQKIDERTKILILCNPNNPTGSFWSLEQLRRFLDRIDGSQIVVVDEAYAEFVEDPSYPDGMALIREYPNLVVFRTFSKMYALAGLRIGYLAGSREVVDIIRRTCVVYSVNALAQVAALAALADNGEHVARTRELIRRGKTFLAKEIANLGLPLCPGRRQLHDDQAAHERCSGLPEAHDPRGHGARHDRFSLSQLDPGDDIPPRSHGGPGGGPQPNARQSRKGKLMAESEEHLIKPGRKWEIALFQPEDAPGIACLFRKVYGDGYPMKTFTDPERLIAENAARRTISVVARTPEGKVVGHAALYPSAPSRGSSNWGRRLSTPTAGAACSVSGWLSTASPSWLDNSRLQQSLENLSVIISLRRNSLSD